jgi:hypothetical protein
MKSKSIKYVVTLLLVVVFIPLIASSSDQGIKKINDDLYVGKKDDLYFVMEKLGDDNIDFWIKYIENQKGKVETRIKESNNLDKDEELKFENILDGIKPFEASLLNDFYKKNDIWIAYATIKPIAEKTFNIQLEQEGDIEMVFSVGADKETPFFSHMGIFRAFEFIDKNDKKHKNLSMYLHSFAAQVINLVYKNKEYMITKPMKIMQNIMEENLHEDALCIVNEFADSVNKKALEKQLHESKATEQLLENFSIEVLQPLDNDLLASINKFIKKNKRKFLVIDLSKNTLNCINGVVKKDKKLIQDKKDEILLCVKNTQDTLKSLIYSTKEKIELATDKIAGKKIVFYSAMPETGESLKKKDYIQLTFKSGEKVSFKVPGFYYHPYLFGSHLPTTIIDAKSLADFFKLDAQEDFIKF